ncbi:MAG: HAD hydrolase-like protein [Planctomycetota bacterium]
MTRTVCFDLDGTLLDSHDGLTRSYAHALTTLGHPLPPPEALRACIGPPLRDNFARLLGTRDVERIEEAVRVFRVRYDAVGWSEGRLYDGVLEMLAAVAALGARVLIATAKPQKFTDRIVAHFGLDRHVEAAFGPTLDGSLDDKRRLVAHMIERTGLDPSRAALVGDRHTDVVAATAHGLWPVGITWGFGSRAELLEAGATTIVDRPDEVVAVVARWLDGAAPDA